MHQSRQTKQTGESNKVIKVFISLNLMTDESKVKVQGFR